MLISGILRVGGGALKRLGVHQKAAEGGFCNFWPAAVEGLSGFFNRQIRLIRNSVGPRRRI